MTELLSRNPYQVSWRSKNHPQQRGHWRARSRTCNNRNINGLAVLINCTFPMMANKYTCPPQLSCVLCWLDNEHTNVKTLSSSTLGLFWVRVCWKNWARITCIIKNAGVYKRSGETPDSFSVQKCWCSNQSFFSYSWLSAPPPPPLRRRRRRWRGWKSQSCSMYRRCQPPRRWAPSPSATSPRPPWPPAQLEKGGKGGLSWMNLLRQFFHQPRKAVTSYDI